MNRTTYLLTGATGLLGQCVLYELLLHHAAELHRVRIVCLGRGTAGSDLHARLETMLEGESGAYLGDALEPSAALEAVVPVHGSLECPGLGLHPTDVARLTREPIDHVLHVAALTDFRSDARVAERLRRINVEGTGRLLELVDAMNRAPRSFNFVSSAYSCGKTYGPVAPDYLNLDQPFQNAYQRCKLEAEALVRSRLAGTSIQTRIFRPSVLAGRLDHAPRGFVSKYDVYLGWASFFLHAKRELLGLTGWPELVDTPLEVPVRLAANPELGLNIVPADFVAALMVAAVATDWPGTSVHVASRFDLQNFAMMERMLELLSVGGHRYVRGIPRDQTPFECRYYRSVGGLYTPYIDLDEPWRFDLESLDALCAHTGIEPRGVSELEDFDVMLEFARARRWGVF